MDASSTGNVMCHIAVLQMSGAGTKETFSDDSQNDCFGVLSGRSADQCLLLGVKQPGIGHCVFGCC